MRSFAIPAMAVLGALGGAVVHGAPQQPAQLIEVNVQVLEVNRSKLTKVGLDWERLLEGDSKALGSLPRSPTHVVEKFAPPISLGKFADHVRLGTLTRGRVDAFVSLLHENDFGKLLAKPKLLTISGSKASFLAGGELPVISVGAVGQVNVTWKEYGVRLSIEPEIRGRMIRTHVRAEVSTVDPVNTVYLPNGTYMPALRTRWAETDVELANRATVIIAGLIQTEDVTVRTGVPILSDIPLLGWLFRHSRTEHLETELVIFVTPSLGSSQAGLAGS